MDKKSKKAQYDMKYARENIHRIPLDVQNDLYDKIKSHADASGESVNGYIKNAIKMRMDREKECGI